MFSRVYQPRRTAAAGVSSGGRRRSAAQAAAFAGIFAVLAACGGGDGGSPTDPPPPPPPTVASVSVTPGSASLTVGGTVQLSAVPRDAQGNALSTAVTWQSGTPAVATVSSSGRVTAVAVGTATITAASGGRSGTATITVSAVPVAAVEVTLDRAALLVGETAQASAVVRDAGGAALSGRPVTWTSSAPAVATVDASGAITAVAPGAAVVTATSEGIAGTAALTVAPVPVAAVEVTLGAASLEVGETTTATAVVRDSAGGALAGRAVTWTSSAPAIATVDASGAVTAVAPGTATLTATSEGVAGTAALTVRALSSPFGPVVARDTIGPAGGTLGNADVAITVPAGTFAGPREVTLARDSVLGDIGGPALASPRYVVDGLPPGVAVPLRVRIRAAGARQGVSAIVEQGPAIDEADDIEPAFGSRYHLATDSSGFLVATVPVAGAPPSWGVPSGISRSRAAAEAGDDPLAFAADFILGAVLGLERKVTTDGRFAVWGKLDQDAAMPAKVARVASLLPQAWTKLVDGLGYVPPDRTWPMQVDVKDEVKGLGVFTQRLPWPPSHDSSTIGFRTDHVDDPNFPGTVIHELFHYMQQAYRDGMTYAEWRQQSWYQEATSSWSMPLHPASPNPFNSGALRSWRDSMLAGLADGMVAKSGYGRAALIAYVAKRWGDAKVKSIWAAMETRGAKTTRDVFLDELGVPIADWWPAAIIQYFGGSLVQWSASELLPRQVDVDTTRANSDFLISGSLRPLEAEVSRLGVDTALFGAATEFPIVIDSADREDARLLVFEKPAAATHWRPLLGTADSVAVPGHRLRSGDSLLVVLTNLHRTQSRSIVYSIGPALPPGDWIITDVGDVNDGFSFACSDTSASASVDPETTPPAVFAFLAEWGVWRWDGDPREFGDYEWTPYPGLADSLARSGVTASARLTFGLEDRVTVRAEFAVAPPTDALSAIAGSLVGLGGGGDALRPAYRLAGARPATAPAGARWWWLGLPVVVGALAVRPRTRKWAAGVGAVAVLGLGACVGFGLGALDIEQRYEFSFERPRFTADPNDPEAVLVELNDGSGTMQLTKFDVELWQYAYDDDDDVIDSTLVTCNGSGTSTYNGVDVAAFGDSVLNADDELTLRMLRATSGEEVSRSVEARLGRLLRPLDP